MPTLVFYILGLKKGRIGLGILFFTVIAIFYIPGNPLLITEYPLNFSSRFLGAFLSVSIIAYVSQSTQKKDCVARWGGEEFLVFLPETSLRQATITAERLRVTIADKDFSYNEISLKITFSAGIAAYQQGLRVDDLINTADRLLYSAKDGGENMVVADITPQNIAVS